jgi:hypothetical protein
MSSKDISNQMNFEDILTNHKIMAKPFYKSTWFFGVTGLATISLIAGSVYSLNQEGDELYRTNQSDSYQITENVPLKVEKATSEILAFNTIQKQKNESITKTESIDKNSSLIHKKKSKKVIEPKRSLIKSELIEKEISKVKNESLNEIPQTFSFMDLHPRISGKLDGKITKTELIDAKGLVTNSEVEIVSFQLHVVDGMSSKVFDAEGNKLNSEMRSAIEKVNVGEEVYFEKIKGQATTGEIFRLSPLRYVLLN